MCTQSSRVEAQTVSNIFLLLALFVTEKNLLFMRGWAAPSPRPRQIQIISQCDSWKAALAESKNEYKAWNENNRSPLKFVGKFLSCLEMSENINNAFLQQ